LRERPETATGLQHKNWFPNKSKTSSLFVDRIVKPKNRTNRRGSTQKIIRKGLSATTGGAKLCTK
jgi:hypothetical protein